MSHLPHRRRKRGALLLSAAAFFFLALLSAVILWNSRGLHKATSRRTQNYLRDVSDGAAQLVDTRLLGVLQAMELVADSTWRIPPADRQEFLLRKAQIGDFSELALVDANGTAHFLHSGAYDMRGYAPLAAAMEGNATMGVWQDHILYLVPIPQGDESAQVLLGVKSMEKMQRLITNDCFGGEGSSCLLDGTGQIVVAPIRKPFSSLIAETSYSPSEGWALAMQQDLAEGRGGSAELTTVSGETILLDYIPLSVGDWFFVTMVPRNILSAEVDAFLSRTSFLILGLVTAFTGVLIAAIRAQSRYRARIEEMAFGDPVTGGESNICFLMEAEALLSRTPRQAFFLVSLNLRNFSMLNEQGGRAHGDGVLKEVYQLLRQELVLPGERVARGEADTFYLLLAVVDRPLALRRLERMTARLSSLGGAAGPLRAKVGIYALPEGQIDLALAENRADLARKMGEGDGQPGCAFYTEEMGARLREEHELLTELEPGLEHGEFLVYFQPKFSPQTEEIGGAEALVRWQHPTRGFISPGVFIPLCESSDLICRVDLFVFEEVCRRLSQWAALGRPLIPISVNLSRRHLMGSDFLLDYKAIADRYQVPAGLIELELTESLMFSLAEFHQMRDLLNEIHRLGFSCSLDDFGFGFSSLGALKELQIDCLKLDRSFFVHGQEEPRAQVVIRSMVQMAQKLGVSVVAEGVEQREQVEFLREIGCDLIQGFYYAPPLSTEKFEALAFGAPLV